MYLPLEWPITYQKPCVLYPPVLPNMSPPSLNVMQMDRKNNHLLHLSPSTSQKLQIRILSALCMQTPSASRISLDFKWSIEGIRQTLSESKTELVTVKLK